MQYTSLMKGMVLKGMLCFRTFIYRCVYNQYQSGEFKCSDLHRIYNLSTISLFLHFPIFDLPLLIRSSWKDLIPRRLRLAAKFYTKPKHVPTSYI